MHKIYYKKILPHAALIFGAILIVGGLFALVRSEEAKTRDTIRMQEVISIKQGLYQYYLNHAAYPPALGPVLLGAGDAFCLSAKGFAGRLDAECTGGGAYFTSAPSGFGVTPDDGYRYIPLVGEDDTFCDAQNGCPRYAIRFYLETNLFARKGIHTLTPEGMK